MCLSLTSVPITQPIQTHKHTNTNRSALAAANTIKSERGAKEAAQQQAAAATKKAAAAVAAQKVSRRTCLKARVAKAAAEHKAADAEQQLAAACEELAGWRITFAHNTLTLVAAQQQRDGYARCNTRLQNQLSGECSYARSQLSVLQKENAVVHEKFRLCTVTWQKNVNRLKDDFRAQLTAAQQELANEREEKQQAQAQLAAVQEQQSAQAAVSCGDAGAVAAASDGQVRGGKKCLVLLGVTVRVWAVAVSDTRCRTLDSCLFPCHHVKLKPLALTLCPADAMLTFKP